MDWAKTRTLVTGGASFIGSDLVEALLERGASARVVDDLSSGRAEYLRDLDVDFLAVKEVMAYTGHGAEIELHPEMPTRPMNRVADNRLAKELLDWEPGVPFVDGLHRTIDRYFETKSPADVAARLETALTER